LIEAITDNKNRTVAEIKKILADNGAKWAEPGSVRWAFESLTDQSGVNVDSRGNWQAKFFQTISPEDKQKLDALIEELNNCDAVQKVYTNVYLLIFYSQ